MIHKNNNDKKDYKPFVSSTGPNPTNQIDTTRQLRAEIYKIVQRMDKREDAFFKKLSGMRNDIRSHMCL